MERETSVADLVNSLFDSKLQLHFQNIAYFKVTTALAS